MKKFSVALNAFMILFFVAACGKGGDSSGPFFTVGGVISGLTGTVVLQNNGGDDLAVAADGPFIFSSVLSPGSPYIVTVHTNPADQTCIVSNGTGTILISNVADVSVECFERGGLDLTFNSPNGFSLQSNVTGSYADDSGNAVTIDSRGRILIAGSSGPDSTGNTDMVVWRYSPDGTLDTTFNNSGFVVQNGSGDAVANALTTDSSGRILITGSSGTTGNTDMVVWRYRDDGTLDTDFSDDGMVSAPIGTADDSGSDIAIDSSGNVVLTGFTTNAEGNKDMVILRFNARGVIDTGFGGGDGIVVYDNAAGGLGDDSGNAVAIDPQGRIIVAGSSRNSEGNLDMVLWRYKSNGTLDTDFNYPKGFIVHSNAAGGSGDDFGNALAIDSQGNIFVAGTSTNSIGNTDMVLWRFTQNGTLDSIFIDNGAAGSNGNDSGNGIAIDSQGRILVSGSSENSADKDMVIWRFKADGALDISFGADGIVVHDNAAGGGGDDFGNAVALDPKDRILVTGSSINSAGNFDMVIWRVFP